MESGFVTMENVIDSIRNAASPLSPEMRQNLQTLIDSSARVVASVNLRLWHEKYQHAAAARQFAQSRVEETKAKVQCADLEEDALGPVRLVKIVICAICWLICAAGEFAITWSTIPFVLNIAEDSVLGIAISGVVVAMLTVVEWGIARALEEPYQAARKSATLSRGFRRAAIVGMGVFLAALLAGNLLTVSLLAKAREESVKLRQNLEMKNGENPLPVDEDAINHAITAISLAVVIDGSILFLAMLGDLQVFDLRLRAALRVAAARRKLPELERAFLAAQADEAVEQQLWNDRDRRLEAVTQEYRNRCLCELQAVAERRLAPPTELTTEQKIDRALARAAAGPRLVAAA